MVRTERLELPEFKFEVFQSGKTGAKGNNNNYTTNKITVSPF
jgi:hypothetical protein